jgi:serine/threonine-protein kinase
MTSPTDPSPGFRPSLATSIFLLFVLLLGLVLGAATFVTWREGQTVAKAAVQRALAASAEVQRELTERRLEEAKLKVQLIAADADFVRYVSDAQGAGLGLGSAPELGSASIGDLLRERQESFGFDVGIVLDPEGAVLARTDEVEALEASLAGDAFVEPALRDLTPIAGFWRSGERLYQAAIVPLALDRDLSGFLLLALAVDDSLATRIARASGAEIVFLLPTEGGALRSAGSLPPETRAAVDGAIAAPEAGIASAAIAGTAIDRVEFDSAGQRWIGRLTAVDAAGGPNLGSVLQLSSADDVTAGYRQILNRVALTGLIALVVALPLSFLLARATLKPLRVMALAAQDAAGGNYRARLGIGGDDELAQLSRAFDRLLSDLREKSDIEGYVTNLSRFLPDPGQEPPVPSFVTQRVGGEIEAVSEMPARVETVRRNALLLAIDQRDFARALGGETPQSVLGMVERRIAELLDCVAAEQGDAVLISGTRLIAAFGGEERVVAALRALDRSVQRAGSGISAALLEGEFVQGVLSGSQSVPVALGPVCFQIDRLLSEAPSGQVLLPRPLADPIKAKLGEGALTVVAGALTGKSYYGVAFAALAGARAAVPDGADMPTKDLAKAALAAMNVPSRPSTELRPGTRFGGRYEILSLLGSGGMGVVYKARDLELDDLVALKMFKAAAVVDREHLERLKSEIKLARKITHPNVLRTFDFGEFDGRPYISMEYVRGMTLRYLLRQAGRLPYSAALRIARQLCAGLEAAHAVGVLHRDIKPENLILEASGNAKLMDFGIARPLSRSGGGHTQPGTFVGTPHYSAPEQLAGDEVDQRADIYSSGVVLCEMFCGKLPFSGGNTLEIYMAQMQQEPIKPSAYWAEIPALLERVILTCIQRERELRYESAAALAAALAELRA